MAPLPGIDVVQDILRPPYPFASESFDYILCSHVLEHVPQIVNGKDGLLTVLTELCRILKPGGTMEVRGPHPRIGIAYFNNPTHYRVITQWTFDSFVGKRKAGSVEVCKAAFWTEISFSKMEVKSAAFIDPPFNSDILAGLMRRVPILSRVLGRPAELVIYLTK